MQTGRAGTLQFFSWFVKSCAVNLHKKVVSSQLPVCLLDVVLLLTRGGVLEAEGTVEIKYRRKDLLKTMRRLDSVYTGLAEQLGKNFSHQLTHSHVFSALCDFFSSLTKKVFCFHQRLHSCLTNSAESWRRSSKRGKSFSCPSTTRWQCSSSSSMTLLAGCRRKASSL